MASLVDGDKSTNESGTSSTLTEEQAERAWKLAEFRMKMMEADYAACIAADKKSNKSEPDNSETFDEWLRSAGLRWTRRREQ